MENRGPRRLAGALSLGAPLGGSVVTLGVFDGVHLGHQVLMAAGRRAALAHDRPLVVYTFDPHPAQVLASKAVPEQLIALDERIERLGELGAAIVNIEPFTPAFAEIPADVWIERYLTRSLCPRHVVVGFNFSFGRQRGGRSEHLIEAGHRFGFSVEVVSAVEVDGATVSSTAIRQRLRAGDVAGARRMLGRPHCLSGEVVKGEQRGRTIGVPTANLRTNSGMIPASGVYASRIRLDDGRSFSAVTNIGIRPTFDGRERSIEAHLLDFPGDPLYGRHVGLDLLKRLRGEQRFSGIDALVAQIRIDIGSAREVFSEEGSF